MRKPKEGSRLSLKLAQPLMDTLDRMSEETEYSKTTLVEKALRQFFEKNGVEVKKNVPQA